MQKSVLGYDYGNAQQTVGIWPQVSSIDYFYAKYGTWPLPLKAIGWEKPTSCQAY